MMRVLIVKDDSAEAELALEVLRSAGIACAGERAATEGEFREALAHAPDLILLDVELAHFDALTALSVVRSERPSTPFILLSRSPLDHLAQEALASGATDCVAQSDPEALTRAVRTALQPHPPNGTAPRRAADRQPARPGTLGASVNAGYLLERQASLERMLHREDASLSSILTRSPPVPIALVMIQDANVRERYLKVLHHACIDTDVAVDTKDATVQLTARTHAVLFTDALDLVRAVRQLTASAATHVVFVSPKDGSASSQALQAGANDTMPEEARGELFWPRLSLARRILSFAGSLQSAVTHNRILATLDELTRCGNRRYFEQQFPQEVARAIRLQRPLALLMCDIDHFKVINDERGHQVGDEVLREVGDRLTHGLRLGEDWVARVGGEEFAIVLPETGHFKALAIAERLCSRVNGSAFETSSGSLRVTGSLGVCAVQTPSPGMIDLRERMIAAADAALYESKRNGRNRVTAAAEIKSASPIAP